jgi:predicted nucleotidyltransferase
MAGTATPVTGPLSGPTGRRVVAHRAQLQDVLRRNGVTNARLFGSVARGDDRDDSDVDILVDFAPGTTLFDVLRVQDELEAILGVGVDLVASSGLKERARGRIERDLITL